jgi:hypothetical protein
MKKALILVADPEVVRLVPGNGTHHSVGHSSYGNEPVILEVGNTAKRADPNPSAIILK